jgi:hypothetical protein
MKSSDQLGELFGALAKAQATMGAALKDSTNPFFKSNYANLEAVVGISRGPLTDNGLCVTQPPVMGEVGEILLTVLGHASGQWISSEIVLKPTKTDPQSLGSYITYMRRYAYASIVGVVTADDDGESAMDRISPVQAAQLRKALNGNKELEGKILTGLSVRKLEEISAGLYAAVLERINSINTKE